MTSGAEVEAREGRIGPDAKGAGLAPPPIAAGPLASVYRDQEALVEIAIRSAEISRQCRLDDGEAGQHVAGNGYVGRGDRAAPVEAGRASMKALHPSRSTG